jgi:hypothetical protein
MLLRRVIYELFDWEVEALSPDRGAGRDELYRQIRLEGADGVRVYVSWDWGRGHPDYFLSWSAESFFTDSGVYLDVSGSPLWRPLIGQQVTVEYRDRSCQVIEVRAEDAVVYCCSFASDRVFVLREPRLPASIPRS